MPCSSAFRAATSALICAAYGVLLRLPLNPAAPALPQQTTAPVGSVIVTIVLLNVEWIWACPRGMFFRSRRLPRTGPLRFPAVVFASAMLYPPGALAHAAPSH